jgi:MFS family permease
MKEKPNFKLILFVLFIVNILNFLDRGIIPGASEEFNQFITNSGIHNHQDVFLGLLQSAFIIGYGIASVVFGNLVHYYPPFYICTSGLSVWIIAVISSGFSYYTGSYICLFLARMASGVGEAAFQISIPPWISKYSPKSQRGMYLSIFFTAIPTGTAIGYAYSALLATTIGWPYAFFIESILMASTLPFLHSITPFYPREVSISSKIKEEKSEDDEKNNILTPTPNKTQPVEINHSYNSHPSPLSPSESQPTLLQELNVLIRTPIYLCTVAGYAAQTGSVIGLSTFGSSFMIGLGYFNTETESSSAFGALVSVAGILSTPLGGYIIDRISSLRKFHYEKMMNDGKISKKLSDLIELQSSLTLICLVNLTGSTLLCLAYVIYDRSLFLTDLFFGVFSLFLSSAGINLVIMLSVPESNRALAIGLSCLGLHLFGDVPSPIIAGLLKDHFAPNCTGSGDSSSSESCRSESHGLRLTLLLVSSWLYVCVIFMTLALLISWTKWRRNWSKEQSQWLLQVDESEDVDMDNLASKRFWNNNEALLEIEVKDDNLQEDSLLDESQIDL